MTLMRSDPFSMTRRTDIPSSPWLDWQGLGGWNIYFLFKLALLWAGYLNFHPLPNLVFACALLLPLRWPGLRRCATGWPYRQGWRCCITTPGCLASTAS